MAPKNQKGTKTNRLVNMESRLCFFSCCQLSSLILRKFSCKVITPLGPFVLEGSLVLCCQLRLRMNLPTPKLHEFAPGQRKSQSWLIWRGISLLS